MMLATVAMAVWAAPASQAADAASAPGPEAAARAAQWSPDQFFYTPDDVRAMRARLAEEPADGPLHRFVEGGEGWVRKLTPDYLARMLPEQTPLPVTFSSNRCPACDKVNFLKWQGHRESGQFGCSFCGVAFPNEEFPETETYTVAGEALRYHQGEGRQRYHFSANLRYQRVYWTMKNNRPHEFLAIAYLLTGDVRFARAAADVMLRYARGYKRWFLHGLRPSGADDRAWLAEAFGLQDMRSIPRHYTKTQWCFDSVFLIHIAFAYGAIRTSGVVSEQEHALLLELARDTIELNTISELYYRNGAFGNMHDPMYRAMIMAGRAFGAELVVRDLFCDSFTLNGVDLVHEAYDGPKGLLYACANTVGPEGCYLEGTGAYYGQLVGGYAMPLILAQGFRDPPGYKPSAKVAVYHRPGRILDPGRDVNLDRFYGFYGIVTRDLTFPALNDSDVGTKPRGAAFAYRYLLTREPSAAAALRALSAPEPPGLTGYNIHQLPLLKNVTLDSRDADAASARFPLFAGAKSNFGLAVLRGSGETDLYLSWDGLSSSHSQYEQLGIVFYAAKREMLLDFGYMGSWGRLRHVWLNRTIAHNTVTVDQDVQKTPQRGELQRWGDFGGVRIVQASDAKAFAGLSQYRRTLALIDRGERPALCLDVFEVDGGRTHDQSWLANGALASLTGADLSPQPGTLLGADTAYGDIRPVADLYTGAHGSGYGFIHKLSVGHASAPLWTAEWRSADSPIKLRLLGPASAEDTLIRGTCPHERVRHRPEERGKQGPIVIVRRQAGSDEPLSSCFATAIEAYADKPAVVDATRVASGRGLEVTLQDDAPVRTALEIAPGGAVAYVARQGGRLRELVLMGRRRWEGLGWRVALEGEPLRSGRILKVDSAALTLLVDGRLPGGQALAGRLVSVWNGAGVRRQLVIESVEPGGANALVRIDRARSGFARNTGLIDEIVDPRTFTTGSYFQSNEWGRLRAGDAILVGDRTFRVAEAEALGWKRQHRTRVTLDADAFPDKSLLGQDFIVSVVAAGDLWGVEMTVHLAREPDGAYRLRSPASVSVDAPPETKLFR